FFSSRRRHTRFSRDWSSDVCSSDLDDRVQLAGSRQSGQVTAVLLQRAVAALSLRVGDALAAANVLDGLHDAVTGDARFAQEARGRRIAVAQDGKEDVLGRNVLVVEAARLFLSALNHAVDARRDEHLARTAAINGRRTRRVAEVFVKPALKIPNINLQVL